MLDINQHGLGEVESIKILKDVSKDRESTNQVQVEKEHAQLLKMIGSSTGSLYCSFFLGFFLDSHQHRLGEIEGIKILTKEKKDKGGMNAQLQVKTETTQVTKSKKDTGGPFGRSRGSFT